MRASLFPDDVAIVQLHRAEGPLRAALDRCGEQGWAIADFDVSGWSDDARLHDDLATTLAFPAYYGRNLDALVDQLRELPQMTDSVGAAPGLAITLRRFDRLIAGDARRATGLLEILAQAALWSLRFGWPVAVLVQTDDPLLDLGPLSGLPVEWNRSERRISDRA